MIKYPPKERLLRGALTFWRLIGLGCLVAAYFHMTWFYLLASLGSHVQVLEFNAYGELWLEVALWLIGAPQVFWLFARLRKD